MPRFTVDIDDRFNETLTSLANGGSKADVIRRAVGTYHYLKSEVPNGQSDKRVTISDANAPGPKSRDHSMRLPMNPPSLAQDEIDVPQIRVNFTCSADLSGALESVHPLGSLFSDAVMGPQGEVAVMTYSDHVDRPLDFTSNGDKL